MAKSYTFNYTGAVQTLVVPDNYSKIIIDAYGSVGGGGKGGKGGRAYGEYILRPTDNRTLNIYVGGSNGYNGGAASVFSNPYLVGGGASDIRINGTAFTNRIIVAGGGGGGYWNLGGAGGGLTGGNGTNDGDGFNSDTGGGGASQTAGGTAGIAGGYGGSYGRNGAAGALGSGGVSGGGGGYYGGGGGAYGTNYRVSAGGGGSSYIDLLTPTTRLTESGVNAGNGYIIITLSTDNRYLIKKGSNYYSLLPEYYDDSIHDFIPLTLEGGSMPNDNDISKFGFEEPDMFTTTMTKGNDSLAPITKFLNTDFEVLYYKYKTT